MKLRKKATAARRVRRTHSAEIKALVALAALWDVKFLAQLCQEFDIHAIMAHKVATTLEACCAVQIMREALARFGVPEIVNTDQGSRFTAQEFTQVVLDSGAKLSMDG